MAECFEKTCLWDWNDSRWFSEVIQRDPGDGLKVDSGTIRQLANEYFAQASSCWTVKSLIDWMIEWRYRNGCACDAIASRAHRSLTDRVAVPHAWSFTIYGRFNYTLCAFCRWAFFSSLLVSWQFRWDYLWFPLLTCRPDALNCMSSLVAITSFAGADESFWFNFFSFRCENFANTRWFWTESTIEQVRRDSITIKVGRYESQFGGKLLKFIPENGLIWGWISIEGKPTTKITLIVSPKMFVFRIASKRNEISETKPADCYYATASRSRKNDRNETRPE